MHNIIKETDVWNIVKETLNHVDKRLTGHGERVAYIAYKMLQFREEHTKNELYNILMVCLLHDIGAYKTEEIDRMVEFETNTIWEHSIYGYLFLDRLSPIKECAEVILYHHVNYTDYEKLPRPVSCMETALLLKLADRIDIMLENGINPTDNTQLIDSGGCAFFPGNVDWFLSADKALHIVDRLKSGEYDAELRQVIDSIHFTEEETHKYLQMLAFSIDFRSQHMVLHTITTNSISMAVAELLGFNEEEMTKIYFGSLLHDLGKVAISVDLLDKPDKLTDEETKIMRRHVEISEEILENYVHPDVCRIAARHHEKLDSSGYPRGLMGEQLSQSERIVAIADIISALIRKRSYKEAFPLSVIRQILEDLRDSNQTCPKITNLILDNFDRILEVSDIRSKEILELYQGITDEYARLLNIFKS